MKLRTLITATGLILAPILAFGQTGPTGQVRAFLVKGDVTLINNTTGESSQLRRGDTFTDGHSVRTTETSSALLIFSNGSSVSVRPDSTFDIEEFSQAPYDARRGSFAQLEADPSTSNTSLRLHDGTLVGEVKALSSSSRYDIHTPNGSAGIRGTKWVASVGVDTDGNPVTTFTNLTGSVTFSTPIQPDDVPITPGESVTLSLDADGNLTILREDAPPIILQLDEALANEVAEALAEADAETPPTTQTPSQQTANQQAQQAEEDRDIPETDLIDDEPSSPI